MKILLALVPALLASSFAVAAPSGEPSDAAKAIRLAQLAYNELQRSQDELVFRRESERSACNLIGRLFALYDAHDEFVAVSVPKTGADGKTAMVKVQAPVPRFTNANMDAVTICRPDSLWQRKPSMKALAAEIARLRR